jgi:hypothetical protein
LFFGLGRISLAITINIIVLVMFRQHSFLFFVVPRGTLDVAGTAAFRSSGCSVGQSRAGGSPFLIAPIWRGWKMARVGFDQMARIKPFLGNDLGYRRAATSDGAGGNLARSAFGWRGSPSPHLAATRKTDRPTVRPRLGKPSERTAGRPRQEWTSLSYEERPPCRPAWHLFTSASFRKSGEPRRRGSRRGP